MSTLTHLDIDKSVIAFSPRSKPVRDIIKEALEPARVRLRLGEVHLESALNTAMDLRSKHGESVALCVEAGKKTLSALRAKLDGEAHRFSRSESAAVDAAFSDGPKDAA
jgi:hypothetical protein